MPRRSIHTANGGALHGAVETFVLVLRFFGLLTGVPGAASSHVNDLTAGRSRSGMAAAAIFIALEWDNTYSVPGRLNNPRPAARPEPVAAQFVPTAMLIACRAACGCLQGSGLTPRGAAADEEPLRLISSVVALNAADGLAVAVAELALRAVWQDAHPPVAHVAPAFAADVSAMRHCVDAAKAPIGDNGDPPASALDPPAGLFSASGYPEGDYFSNVPL